jgi:hypothetical protein
MGEWLSDRAGLLTARPAGRKPASQKEVDTFRFTKRASERIEHAAARLAGLCVRAQAIAMIGPFLIKTLD